MYKLCFYVPISNVEKVKTALFSEDAKTGKVITTLKVAHPYEMPAY